DTIIAPAKSMNKLRLNGCRCCAKLFVLNEVTENDKAAKKPNKKHVKLNTIYALKKMEAKVCANKTKITPNIFNADILAFFRMISMSTPIQTDCIKSTTAILALMYFTER